jgi:hypothetical protein
MRLLGALARPEAPCRLLGNIRATGATLAGSLVVLSLILGACSRTGLESPTPSGLRIVSISSPWTTVTPGQVAIPVDLIVENLLDRDILLLGATIWSPSVEVQGHLTGGNLSVLEAHKSTILALVGSVGVNAAIGTHNIHGELMVGDSASRSIDTLRESHAALIWEISGVAPPGAQLDSDGDGLTNDVEIAFGLEPFNVDSDRDTWDDDVEWGQNADSPRDTDDDGVPDALDSDSDNGGESDLLERLSGHNPLEASDDTPAPVLLVTTAADENDLSSGSANVADAGPLLSLREAIELANNHVGPDSILFSPDVFPIGGATPITLALTSGPDSALPSITDADTTIVGDGRVEILWNQSQAPATAALLIEGDRTTLQQLAMSVTTGPPIWPAYFLHAVLAQRVVLAGTTIGAEAAGTYNAHAYMDGSLEPWIYDCSFRGSAINALMLRAANFARVERSVLELTTNANGGGILIDASGGVSLLDNTVRGHSGCGVRLNSATQALVARTSIEGNGLDGISISGGSDNLIEENYILANGKNGVSMVYWTYRNQIRRNSIAGNALAAISIERNVATDVGGNSDIRPPVVDVVAADHVSGQAGPSCSAAAADQLFVVEVFWDNADEAANYLGAIDVSACQWSLQIAVPAGGFVSATITNQAGDTSALSSPHVGW